MKMIKWNNESVDARNQRSSCYERDYPAHQKIFYQFQKDHEKVIINNI